MPENVSIKPSEMVEGGAVAVDLNLLVKEAKFALFDYQGKAPSTAAVRLVLADDDGTEHIQHYSAADPTRFVPSQDGKSLIAVGSATSLSKSSNFAILMANLVSAGFPENKLAQDIGVLNGLYAFWIGVPEPKRPGLVRADDRERVIPVPSQIHRLPWEAEKAGAAPPGVSAQASAPTEAPASGSRAIEFIGKVVAESGGSATRQDIAAKVFTDLASDPDRDAIATAVFAPATLGMLLAGGFKIDGEVISK